MSKREPLQTAGPSEASEFKRPRGRPRKRQDDAPGPSSAPDGIEESTSSSSSDSEGLEPGDSEWVPEMRRRSALSEEGASEDEALEDPALEDQALEDQAPEDQAPGPSSRPPAPRRRRQTHPPHPLSKYKHSGFNQTIRSHQDPFRPVLYKMHPKQMIQMKTPEDEKDPKTRINMRIIFKPVQQFQDVSESVDPMNLENVEVKTFGETLQSYMEASRIFENSSEKFFERIVPIAVEYPYAEKFVVLEFGKVYKKLSKDQKLKLFQHRFHRPEKKEKEKKTKSPQKKTFSGYLPLAKEPKIDHKSDRNLFEQHGMGQWNKSKHQKLIRKFKGLLMTRRTSDDIIRDSSFFVREFLLSKNKINLRIQRTMDIPLCEVPPTMLCGYFPLSARCKKDQMMYLAARYQEAQLEYLNLTTRPINPPEGYEVDSITAQELWKFHEEGHHIHGFYTVWKATGEEVEDEEGKIVKKRYLVDIFNFLKFPLYARYDRWDNRIKASFDVNTTYLLNLAEIIRCNAPVFFRIHPEALHNPVTLREMCEAIGNRHYSAKLFANSMDLDAFYGEANGNISFETISAYFMIMGGSKQMILKDSESPDVQEPFRFYPINEKELVFFDRDGTQLQVDSEVPIKRIISRDSEFADKEAITINKVFKHSDPPRTHVITDVKKIKTPKPPPPGFVVVPRQRVTRMKLIHWRNQKLGLPRLQKTPKKKKPGRKPEDPLKKLLDRHGFEQGGILEEDFESDLEGFTYTDQHLPSQTNPPKLHRSTSSESIFLSSTYTDYPLDRLSIFHQRQFSRIPERFKERRARKLGKLAQGRMIRARMVVSRNLAESEVYHCCEQRFPRLELEVKRMPHSNLINDCADTLKLMISQLVAKESTQIQISNLLTKTRQEGLNSRILQIQKLPQIQKPPLHPKMLAIQWLADTKITNPWKLEEARWHLRDVVIRGGDKKPRVHRVIHHEPRSLEMNRKLIKKLRDEGKKKKEQEDKKRSRSSGAKVQIPRVQELEDQDPRAVQEPIRTALTPVEADADDQPSTSSAPGQANGQPGAHAEAQPSTSSAPCQANSRVSSGARGRGLDFSIDGILGGLEQTQSPDEPTQIAAIAQAVDHAHLPSGSQDPAPTAPAIRQTPARTPARPASAVQPPQASPPAPAPNQAPAPTPAQPPAQATSQSQAQAPAQTPARPASAVRQAQAFSSAPVPAQAPAPVPNTAPNQARPTAARPVLVIQRAPASPSASAPPASALQQSLAPNQASTEAPAQSQAQASTQAPTQSASAERQDQASPSAPATAPASEPSHWIHVSQNDLGDFWTAIEQLENPKSTPSMKKIMEGVISDAFKEQSNDLNQRINLENCVKILLVVCYLQSKRIPRTRKEASLKLDGIPEVEEVMKKILEASTWIQLAGKQKVEFRSLVNHNGFPRIGEQFQKIKEKILELAGLQVVKDQAPGKTDLEIFLEVVAVLKTSLENKMSVLYKNVGMEELLRWTRGNQEFVEKIGDEEIEDLADGEEGFDIMMTWLKKLMEE